MTIHFFTKGDESIASFHCRVYFLADELRKIGYTAQVHIEEKFSLRDVAQQFVETLRSQLPNQTTSVRPTKI